MGGGEIFPPPFFLHPINLLTHRRAQVFREGSFERVTCERKNSGAVSVVRLTQG